MGITYYLDIVENVPPVPDHHLTVHTVIVYVGTNAIKLRLSIKLQQYFEFLTDTIESLGKQCIFPH